MSFVHTICQRLGEDPGRTAIVADTAQGDEPSQPTSLTAGELLERVAAFRAGLRARGVQPGDRVALLASNSAEWVACDLAVLAEGAALVPLDARQAPAERAGVVADADPKLLILQDGLQPLEGREHASLSELAVEGEGWTPLRDLAPDVVATIIYTSGSSGEPKGAILTHANMSFMLERTEQRLAELSGLPFGEERALHYLPLCYAGSRVLLLSCLLRGARLHLLADPKRLGGALGEAQADYLLNVPLVLERFQRAAVAAVETKGKAPARLLRESLAAWDRIQDGRAGLRDRLVVALARKLIFSSIKARFGERLKGVVCGSAPLAVSTQRFFQLVGVDVYQGYGLTETTALCTLDRADTILPGRVGPALPGVEMRRADDGEIQTRGPHVFQGYWGRADATRAAFSADGWFRTGDLGDVDEQGRWQIQGRSSAVLVLSTGHNVAPEPVEDALRRALAGHDPALADAQVVALGHGRPHLVALVAPGDETPLDAGAVEQVVDELNQTLSPKQKIHGVHVAPAPFGVDEGLLTANLKVRRGAVAERYAGAVDALYRRQPATARSK